MLKALGCVTFGCVTFGCCQTLSGPLPQSGSPAREARGAAAAAPRENGPQRQAIWVQVTLLVVSYVDFFIDRVYILLPCHLTYIEQLIDPSSYNVNSTVVYWLRYTT